MENILHDFNKKITTLMENYLKNLILKMEYQIICQLFYIKR